MTKPPAEHIAACSDPGMSGIDVEVHEVYWAASMEEDSAPDDPVEDVVGAPTSSGLISRAAFRRRPDAFCLPARDCSLPKMFAQDLDHRRLIEDPALSRRLYAQPTWDSHPPSERPDGAATWGPMVLPIRVAAMDSVDRDSSVGAESGKAGRSDGTGGVALAGVDLDRQDRH